MNGWLLKSLFTNRTPAHSYVKVASSPKPACALSQSHRDNSAIWLRDKDNIASEQARNEIPEIPATSSDTADRDSLVRLPRIEVQIRRDITGLSIDQIRGEMAHSDDVLHVSKNPKLSKPAAGKRQKSRSPAQTKEIPQELRDNVATPILLKRPYVRANKPRKAQHKELAVSKWKEFELEGDDQDEIFVSASMHPKSTKSSVNGVKKASKTKRRPLAVRSTMSTSTKDAPKGRSALKQLDKNISLVSTRTRRGQLKSQSYIEDSESEEGYSGEQRPTANLSHKQPVEATEEFTIEYRGEGQQSSQAIGSKSTIPMFRSANTTNDARDDAADDRGTSFGIKLSNRRKQSIDEECGDLEAPQEFSRDSNKANELHLVYKTLVTASPLKSQKQPTNTCDVVNSDDRVYQTSAHYAAADADDTLSVRDSPGHVAEISYSTAKDNLQEIRVSFGSKLGALISQNVSTRPNPTAGLDLAVPVSDRKSPICDKYKIDHVMFQNGSLVTPMRIGNSTEVRQIGYDSMNKISTNVEGGEGLTTEIQQKKNINSERESVAKICSKHTETTNDEELDSTMSRDGTLLHAQSRSNTDTNTHKGETPIIDLTLPSADSLSSAEARNISLDIHQSKLEESRKYSQLKSAQYYAGRKQRNDPAVIDPSVEKTAPRSGNSWDPEKTIFRDVAGADLSLQEHKLDISENESPILPNGRARKTKIVHFNQSGPCNQGVVLTGERTTSTFSGSFVPTEIQKHQVNRHEHLQLYEHHPLHNATKLPASQSKVASLSLNDEGILALNTAIVEDVNESAEHDLQSSISKERAFEPKQYLPNYIANARNRLPQFSRVDQNGSPRRNPQCFSNMDHAGDATTEISRAAVRHEIHPAEDGVQSTFDNSVISASASDESDRVLEPVDRIPPNRSHRKTLAGMQACTRPLPLRKGLKQEPQKTSPIAKVGARSRGISTGLNAIIDQSYPGARKKVTTSVSRKPQLEIMFQNSLSAQELEATPCVDNVIRTSSQFHEQEKQISSNEKPSATYPGSFSHPQQFSIVGAIESRRDYAPSDEAGGLAQMTTFSKPAFLRATLLMKPTEKNSEQEETIYDRLAKGKSTNRETGDADMTLVVDEEEHCSQRQYEREQASRGSGSAQPENCTARNTLRSGEKSCSSSTSDPDDMICENFLKIANNMLFQLKREEAIIELQVNKYTNAGGQVVADFSANKISLLECAKTILLAKAESTAREYSQTFQDLESKKNKVRNIKVSEEEQESASQTQERLKDKIRQMLDKYNEEDDDDDKGDVP